MKQLILPKWLAFQTYKFGTEDSRTFISNERIHEFVLLEGLASDLWKIITDTQDYNQVKQWTETKGLAGDLDEFIEELKAQDLIILNDIVELSNADTDIQPVGCDNEEESVKLEEDMIKWCVKNGYLFSLFIELTYNCNLKCVHCYNPKSINSIQSDVDKIKEIIDQARELGVFKITFSGGECTLHKNFIDIVEYTRNKRMSVEIFTNGQTLYDNPELLNKLIKTYPYRIGLSMYSLNEDTHEKITSVKGSHNKTLSVIKELRKNNINIQIKNFLLNINCKDCISVQKFANEIQANTAGDTSLTPTIEGDKKNFQYIVGEEDLYELYTNPESPLNVRNMVKRDISKIKNEGLCAAGSFGLCVSPTLEVHPCVSLPINLGNLNEVSLKDIWQEAINKNNNSKLYQWQQISFKDLKECYKKDYCAFCNYCAGMGMLENGYLKKSDVLCRQAKVKQKAYEKLHSIK
ncbi:radical SAM protein [bacterium]|nr:radical SAM protein [bacterium]